MTWPFGQREASLSATQLLNERTGLRWGKSNTVSRSKAYAHSAVWACLRLRADLVSSMPVDVFRRVGGVQVELPKPPVFVKPGGANVYMDEWLYNTQIDLDSCGNTFGLIRARDGLQLPSVIELLPADECALIKKDGKVRLRVGGDVYDYGDVWHERQYTRSGLMVGLSPIAYAAMTINAHLSAQEFAREWFDNSATPSAHFRNIAKVLKPGQAASIKRRFKESLQNGEPLVTGKDWEYSMLGAKASEAGFLEQQRYSVQDVCRFLGVPVDTIDGESGSSMTYANISQRNLQLLIMNLGPAIQRRERALSAGLLPQPRYAKLNTGALLRMDTKSRLDAHKVAIDARIYPPSRALDLENMPPLTPEEKAEFAELFPGKASTPAPAPNGGQ